MPGSRVSFFCNSAVDEIYKGECALTAFIKPGLLLTFLFSIKPNMNSEQIDSLIAIGLPETFVLRSFFKGQNCLSMHISECALIEKNTLFIEKCFLTALKIILLPESAIDVILSLKIHNSESRKKIINHFCEKQKMLETQLLHCQEFKKWFCAPSSQINFLLQKLNEIFANFPSVCTEIQLLFEKFSADIKNISVTSDDDFVIIHSPQTFYGWLANLDHDVSPARGRSSSHVSNGTEEVTSDDELMEQISSSRFVPA